MEGRTHCRLGDRNGAFGGDEEGASFNAKEKGLRFTRADYLKSALLKCN